MMKTYEELTLVEIEAEIEKYTENLKHYKENLQETLQELAEKVQSWDMKKLKRRIKEAAEATEVIKGIEDILSELEKVAAKTREEAASEENGLTVIDEFLAQWRKKAFNAYTSLKADYDSIRADREKRMKFLWDLTKSAAHIITYPGSFERNLNDVLDFEVKKKKILLLQRITKKAGNIIDAAGLYIGNNGEINGTVIGEKCAVTVQTIYAGGYNIQKLHYRVLVK